jgi:hypothetical protein
MTRLGIHYDSDHLHGCVSACIKTILQRDDVPSFWEKDITGDKQDELIRSYLNSIGLDCVMVYAEEGSTLNDTHFNFQGHVMAWGWSPNIDGFMHCVVAHCYNYKLHMTHDPALGRVGLKNDEFLGILIITHPVKHGA